MKTLRDLPLISRVNAINLADFYGNVVVQGLINMNLPFTFKTCDAWRNILASCDFDVKTISPVGFPEVSFHGFYQVKIVCDSIHKYRKDI